MKYLLVWLGFCFCILCAGAPNAYSQKTEYVDVIYLKNGSRVRGTIVENVPGKTIRLSTQDGSELVFEYNEVERIVKEEREEEEQVGKIAPIGHDGLYVIPYLDLATTLRRRNKLLLGFGGYFCLMFSKHWGLITGASLTRHDVEYQYYDPYGTNADRFGYRTWYLGLPTGFRFLSGSYRKVNIYVDMVQELGISLGSTRYGVIAVNDYYDEPNNLNYNFILSTGIRAPISERWSLTIGPKLILGTEYQAYGLQFSTMYKFK